MNSKKVANISAIVFGVGALLHLARIVFSLSAFIGNYKIPSWISIFGVIFAGWLSIENWKSSKK